MNNKKQFVRQKQKGPSVKEKGYFAAVKMMAENQVETLKHIYKGIPSG